MFDRRKRVPAEPAGPESLGEVLSRLFTARGWGRKQDRLRLEAAWAAAAGPDVAPHTRLGALRRGVLEVVSSAVTIQDCGSAVAVVNGENPCAQREICGLCT